MTNSPEILRFYPNRTKLVLFAAGCSVGVTMGVWLCMLTAILGGLFVAMFGLALVVVVLQLLPNSS